MRKFFLWKDFLCFTYKDLICDSSTVHNKQREVNDCGLKKKKKSNADIDVVDGKKLKIECK